MATTTTTASGIYEQLGVTPVINARGNNTVLGGSTPSARVWRAMQDAERYYVDMQQLLERSGQVIADLLECEAAYVTPGAAASLALGAAACMTGAFTRWRSSRATRALARTWSPSAPSTSAR